MADVKISALPSATTPLAGTEVLPIVQSATTVKVAISEAVNTPNTHIRRQTSNGSNLSPVTQEGFIFQTLQAGLPYARAGLQFTNRFLNNASQTLEAWTTDTANNFAVRFLVNQNGNFLAGTTSDLTYGFGNAGGTATTNFFKIGRGNTGVGFSNATDSQFLNFYVVNASNSQNTIARIEMTATSKVNNAEAGYLSFYTKSGAASVAALERLRINADGTTTFYISTSYDYGRSAYANSTLSSIYSSTTGGAAYPFQDNGHLILEPRLSGATRDVVVIGSGGNVNVIFKGGGDVEINRGTLDVMTAPVRNTRANSTSDAYIAQVTGEANRRFAIRSDGQHTWGPGSAGTDTNLYRSANDTLKTDDDFQANSYAIGTTSVIPSTRHFQLRSYTVATLPSAANAGEMIYVSNAGGNGPCMAVSNGTNWKRCDNTSTTVV